MGITGENLKKMRPFRWTTVENKIARRKQEICSLYRLAYQKDYNMQLKQLNGSVKGSTNESLERSQKSTDNYEQYYSPMGKKVKM